MLQWQSVDTGAEDDKTRCEELQRSESTGFPGKGSVRVVLGIQAGLVWALTAGDKGRSNTFSGERSGGPGRPTRRTGFCPSVSIHSGL